MDCESFDHRLDALLEGRCSADEWRGAEAHLAACPRCRRVFDAVSGRADDMDAAGHEALARDVVARTSGGACSAARDRLCDFVDGALPPLDRDLVAGHLAHCATCSSLAAALAETAAVLPSFAALPPCASLVPGVLAATSRRPVRPTAGERISAWLAHAVQRPRFSLEVAYVLTLLLLVAFGNPVDAFKDASVRVAPRVTAVAGAVRAPIEQLRATGERRLATVEGAVTAKAAPAGVLAGSRTWLWQWWEANVAAPARSLLATAGQWATQVVDAVRTAFGGSESEPPAGRMR